MRSQKERMLSGELYDPLDAQLFAERRRARLLTKALNDTDDAQQDERSRLISELIPHSGDAIWIEPPFYCDYGSNITLGDRVFFNFNCVVLDVAPVRIGSGVLFGPAVQVYAATHPLGAAERRKGLEYGRPVEVGDDVWVGGGAIICPGVRVGARSVIGAGSVVTRDIPEGVFAAGNPCRVIRKVEEKTSGLLNSPSVNPTPQPIYLFADSQLLFWREEGELFLNSIRRLVTRDSPRAAYVGASNDDAPEFYSIFEAAMDGVGLHRRRMISRSFSAEDRSFLREADLILLAGGEVERGWRVFVETGMREFILRRYDEGAVLIGISAGAAQLGLYGSTDRGASPARLFETFRLVPFVVDAHDEGREWGRLRSTIRLLSGAAQGIGIPTGGGLIYYPDRRVEAIRRPLHQLSVEGERLRETFLLPRQGEIT